MKVAVFFHRLGPYHFARLRAAGALASIVAIESCRVDETYAWDVVAGADGFERLTLFDQERTQKLPARVIASRVGSALDKVQPAIVVVPGWVDKAALAALKWSVEHGVPVVCMSESTEWDGKRRAWSEKLKRRIVGLCSSALVGGAPHRDYMVKLGMPAERIFLGYDAVDGKYFASEAQRARSGQRRAPSAMPSAPFFLASARFVEQKNLPRLIEAYARYRSLAEKLAIGNWKSEIWSLVILGDGALRPALNSQLSTLQLHAHVQMPGFIQYPELPAYYANAGAFVHVSTKEPWGLVVNEAMASRLPVLVSNRCGCAPDLVQEGVNGFTFDPHDVEQLAQLMFQVSGLRSHLSEFGSQSQRIISEWGPERFAVGLKSAAEKAISVGPQHANWMTQILLRTLLCR